MEKPPKIEGNENTFFQNTLDSIKSEIKEIENAILKSKEQIRQAEERLELILNGNPVHQRDVNMIPEIRENRIKHLNELIEFYKKSITDFEKMILSSQEDSNIMLKAADYIDQKIEMKKIDEIDDDTNKLKKLPN